MDNILGKRGGGKKALGVLARGSLIGLFFAALWLPLIGTRFHWFPKYRNTENRTLAQRPALTWRGLSGYPKAYEAYFSDHFGLRSLLVRIDSFVKLEWFHTSPSPQVPVLLGKDGWLYFTAQDIITDYRCVGLFPQAYLEHVAKTIEERQRRLKQMGIGYLIVIIPEKSTVYPEHLPDTVRKVGRQSKCDQVMAYLTPRVDVPLLDLRERFMKAKGPLPLYSMTDSHWNEYAGLLACQEIAGRLASSFPGVTPLALSDFIVTVKTNGHFSGDLACMLSRPDLFRELDLEVTHGKGMTGSPRKIRKLVLFNDSYIDAMDPYLGFWFETIVHNRFKNFDPAIVERENPDVVIEQMAERALSFRF